MICFAGSSGSGLDTWGNSDFGFVNPDEGVLCGIGTSKQCCRSGDKRRPVRVSFCFFFAERMRLEERRK